MSLTSAQRDALPATDFAVPSKRALPIHDKAHVKMAWNVVDRAKDLTDDERVEAKRRILDRAKSLGVDTSGWDVSGIEAATGSDPADAVKDDEDSHAAEIAAMLAALLLFWRKKTLIGLGFMTFSDDLPADLADWSKERAGWLLSVVNDTTAKELRAALTKAATSPPGTPGAPGAPGADAVQAVKDVFARAAKTRAPAIAADAAVASNGQAVAAAAAEAGVKSLRWITQRDSQVRHTHRGMEGQIQPVGGLFVSPSGAMTRHPGGFGVPEEDCNCRCYLEAVRDGQASADPEALWAAIDADVKSKETEVADLFRRIFEQQQEAVLKALSADGMAASGDNSLYVRRNLTKDCAAAFTDWAKAQGFTNITPADELHATVVYSRGANPELPDHFDSIRAASVDGRKVAPLGDKGAVVLHFCCPELEARWKEACDAGATWDYPGGYQPHVTISYDAGGMDLSKVAPFGGVLEFGPEIHEPVNETWAEDKGLRAGLSMEAMSLAVPDCPDHPNRMPFSGVLTKLDTPSDNPPHGSNGKRVTLTKAAAEKALPTLLGMAVDFTPGLDGHDATSKCGIITEAEIVGSEIQIKGFIYAADFPEEARRIQSDKDKLGFSWELKNIHVEDVKAATWVIVDCTFTGAAILQKDKAAYTTTSLAAAADEEIDMATADEIMKALEGITSRLDKLEKMENDEANAAGKKPGMEAANDIPLRVKPFSDGMRTLADAMEAAGVGCHASRGHVMVLRDMANGMDANALAGTVPDAYWGFAMYAGAAPAPKADNSAEITALKDGIASLTTMVKDMQAAGTQRGAAPERKTLPPVITTLLAKAGVAAPGEGEKLDAGVLDAALSGTGMSAAQRIELKSNLRRAGAL